MFKQCAINPIELIVDKEEYAWRLATGNFTHWEKQLINCKKMLRIIKNNFPTNWKIAKITYIPRQDSFKWEIIKN